MSFGGLGGLAGARLIQAASIHPVGRYVSVSPNGVPSVPPPVYPVSGADIFWRKSGPSDTPPGGEGDNNGALQYLSIAGFTDDIEVNLLEGCAAVPDPLLNPDPAFGTLVTAVPGVFQHGLPANFGRGRNRWRPGDEDYINVWFRLPPTCQGDATAGGAVLLPDVVSVGFLANPGSPTPQELLAVGAQVLGNLVIKIGNRGRLPVTLSVAGFPDAPIMNIEFMHTIQR